MWKSSLAHFYPRTPLIFGHRGASAQAPENTLPAFGLAVEQGADGIELDVTLSADGVPVVIHDDSLDRTTSGHGPVSAHTAAELEALEAGLPAAFGDRFAGTRLPTLHQVLEAYGQRALFNIELKHDRSPRRGLAAAVIAVIRTHALERRVLISSFQFSNLRRVRALAPELPIGLLYVSAAFSRRLAGWLTASLNPEAHHPSSHQLTSAAINWYHEHGLRVNVWTVNNPVVMQSLAAAGVDGLITDDPALAVRTLRSEPA